MKYSFLYLLLFGMIYTCCAYGQPARFRHKHRIIRDTTRNTAYIDSLRAFKVKLNAETLSDSSTSEAISDARFFRLFPPLTYYNSVVKDRLHTDENSSGYDVNSAIAKALMHIYITHPELVENEEKDIQREGALHEDIKTPIRNKVRFSDKVDLTYDDGADTPVEIVVKKPNFWTFSGDYYMQFLQNYVSGNWYKGGESNYSMVASATLQANYNNKQKVTFDNKLELKLGFQTSKGDTLHGLKTSEDLIRYTGKFGLQASKKWYYTLQLVAYTQFLRGYKSNDPFVYSDVMSPFNANLSLGMSYTVKALNDKLTGSIQLAPIAMNFKYVARKNLATRYGLDENKHTLTDYGSECTFDLTWKMSESIKWKTRLYGYTTYKRTEIEWENTISFQFNKFISSNIFIYPRFDDGSSTKDDKHGYWQLKEYASIGFAYSF